MNQFPVGAVAFENVSKRYRLGTLGTLRGELTALMNRRKNDQHVLWALKDVNFRLKPGQTLGLIGPNGAGKTTVLKLLSNVTRPTAGRIRVGGRVSSLIELGAGFHPELTGRENIFLNGAILGLSRADIRRKLDAIIAFSELERFIDTPVKRYSSGMYVRLGFAVAAYVEPDVLLVDEVLAVGDASFRQKCMARMEYLRHRGTTLIFVSHNMYQIQRLCDQALLLLHGQTAFLGSTPKAITYYEEQTHLMARYSGVSHQTDITKQNIIVITNIELLQNNGTKATRLHHNQPLTVRVNFQAVHPVHDPIVKVRLIRADGHVVAMSTSRHFPQINWLLESKGVIVLRFEPIQLATGAYYAEMRIIDSGDTEVLASGQSERFFVQGPSMAHEIDVGVFVPRISWHLFLSDKRDE